MSTSHLPPQNVLLSTDLVTLAKEINDLHDRATEAALKTIEHARECGELLNQAKEQVGHGVFLAWLGSNCRVKLRQAQKYMRLAREWAAIEAKSASDAHLTIDGALRLLDSGEKVTQREPAQISAEDPFDEDADPVGEGSDTGHMNADGQDHDEEQPTQPPRNGTEVPRGASGGKSQKELFETQKAKTVKTLEACMRAINDLNRLRKLPRHDAMIKALQKMLETIKALNWTANSMAN